MEIEKNAFASEMFHPSDLRLISIKRLKVALLSDKICEHAQYQLLHKTPYFYFICATEEKVN